MFILISALIVGVCVGALGVFVAALLRSGQSAGPASRRYREFQKVWVVTNLLAWGGDGSPVTGATYRVRATVGLVDEEGISVEWASPLPIAPNGVIERRPILSAYYTWDDLRTRRPLTAWY